MARVEVREGAEPLEEEDTGSGLFDIVTVTGHARLMTLLLRVLFLRPGEVHHRPELGGGLQDFRGKPPTPTNLSRARNRITNTVGLFEREVQDHSVTVRRGESGLMVFDLRIQTDDGAIVEVHEVEI